MARYITKTKNSAQFRSVKVSSNQNEPSVTQTDWTSQGQRKLIRTGRSGGEIVKVELNVVNERACKARWLGGSGGMPP